MQVIGMDVRELAGRPAGKGRVANELARRLPAMLPGTRFRYYSRHLAAPESLGENVEWVEKNGPGLLWHRRVAADVDRTCDGYFAPTSYLVPQLLHIPTVPFVHDLIAFMPAAAGQRRAALIERLTLRRAVRRAAMIVTNSEATRGDLGARVPEAAEKTTVAPLAAGPQFHAQWKAVDLRQVRERYGLPERFILTTGTLEPRKNHAMLLAALKRLPERPLLVIAGKPGWQTKPIFEAINHAKASGIPVRYLEYVPEEDLPALYAAADVFAYVSLYEGFGLPVLEAMQSGVPVVCSDVPSLTEVGAAAVLTVDPRDSQAIAEALRSLWQDPGRRRRLAAAGRKRAKAFSWERTARAVAAALRRLG